MTRSVVVMVCLVGAASVAAGDEKDKDPVKEKLFAAKVAYDMEMTQFRKMMGDWFDKREDTARKTGDKKALDLSKTERKAFDEDGVLPKTTPATVVQKSVQAKKTLEGAYALAVKEYTKVKKDDQAAAAEKELESFRKSTDLAPWIARFPPGTYTETNDSGTKAATVELRRDGTFTRTRSSNGKQYAGTVTLEGGKLILRSESFVDVWTIGGTEIKVEFWWPANSYPNGKTDMKGTVARSKN